MSGNRRQSPQVVLALAIGASIAEAASHAGVNERTLRRWLNDPAFVAEVQAARADLMQRAMGRMIGAMTNASRTLLQVCDHGSSDAARVAAAKAILDGAISLRESIDLEQTVAALEAAISARAQPRPARLRVVRDTTGS